MKAHAYCNVETDLARIGVFEAPEKPDTEVVLSDLQLALETALNQRLGAGRSGWYRGKYLKGIGRTLGAGNWNNPLDVGHSSGHMYAMAGLREWIITKFLRAAGLEYLLVPCEGVLLRPVVPQLARLKSGRHRSFRDLVKKGWFRIDRRLQVITVKPGGFTRWSNLRFAAATMPLQDCLPEFVELLAETLTGEPFTAELTARVLTELVAQAIETTLSNFVRAARAGIHWGSLPNNFTCDGRVLDLETAHVLPTGGIVRLTEADDGLLSGDRFLAHSPVVQPVLALLNIRAQLGGILSEIERGVSDPLLSSPDFRRFGRELVRRLRGLPLFAAPAEFKRLSRSHYLRALPPDMDPGQRRVAEVCFNSLSDPSVDVRRDIKWERLPVILSQRAPWKKAALFTPREFARSLQGMEAATSYSHYLSSLHDVEEVAGVFAQMRRVRF